MDFLPPTGNGDRGSRNSSQQELALVAGDYYFTLASYTHNRHNSTIQGKNTALRPYYFFSCSHRRLSSLPVQSCAATTFIANNALGTGQAAAAASSGSNYNLLPRSLGLFLVLSLHCVLCGSFAPPQRKLIGRERTNNFYSFLHYIAAFPLNKQQHPRIILSAKTSCRWSVPSLMLLTRTAITRSTED